MSDEKFLPVDPLQKAIDARNMTPIPEEASPPQSTTPQDPPPTIINEEE